MNVCKVLDMNPGLEMSSWGTIHFPKENRILEWYIRVEDTQWKFMRFERCLRAPEGGFPEVKAGHERMLEEWSEKTGHQINVQMVCKEGISEEETIRLVFGELQKAGFPYSLNKEAETLRKRLRICNGSLKETARPRFKVE